MNLSDITPRALLHEPESALEIWSRLEEFRQRRPNFYALLREVGDLMLAESHIDGVDRERRLHQHVRPVYRAIERDYVDWMLDSSDPGGPDHPRIRCKLVALYYYHIIVLRRSAREALWHLERLLTQLPGDLNMRDVNCKIPVEIFEDAIRRGPDYKP